MYVSVDESEDVYDDAITQAADDAVSSSRRQSFCEAFLLISNLFEISFMTHIITHIYNNFAPGKDIESIHISGSTM